MEEKIARHELVCHGLYCKNRVIKIGDSYSTDGAAYYCADCVESPSIEAICKAGCHS